jgi:hypothetical protein
MVLNTGVPSSFDTAFKTTKYNLEVVTFVTQLYISKYTSFTGYSFLKTEKNTLLLNQTKNAAE